MGEGALFKDGEYIPSSADSIITVGKDIFYERDCG